VGVAPNFCTGSVKKEKNTVRTNLLGNQDSFREKKAFRVRKEPTGKSKKPRTHGISKLIRICFSRLNHPNRGRELGGGKWEIFEGE